MNNEKNIDWKKYKENIKQFIKDAIASFIYWTGILTLYMIFIVKTDFNQYLAWLVMQAILVPPLGAVFSIIARKLKKSRDKTIIGREKK